MISRWGYFFYVFVSEHYEPQLSTSSAAAGGGGEGGGMYLNAYEVSFPLEDNAERPPTYHLNHGQQMMDGASVHDVQLSRFSTVLFDSQRCSFLSSCRAWSAGASSPSVQPLHPGLQPAGSPVRLPGEELLAAEAHWRAGGGAKLPALSAEPLHRQHESRRLVLLCSWILLHYELLPWYKIHLQRHCEDKNSDVLRIDGGNVMFFTPSPPWFWPNFLIYTGSCEFLVLLLKFDPMRWSVCLQPLSGVVTLSVLWRSSPTARQALPPPWPPGLEWPWNACRTQDLEPAATSPFLVRKNPHGWTCSHLRRASPALFLL